MPLDESNEEQPPDTDWCTFDDYERCCGPELTHADRRKNWHVFLKEKALETLAEVEKYLVRNRRNVVFKKKDAFFEDVDVDHSLQFRNGAEEAGRRVSLLKIKESDYQAEHIRDSYRSKRTSSRAESYSERSESLGPRSTRHGALAAGAGAMHANTLPPSAFLDAENLPQDLVTKLKMSKRQSELSGSNTPEGRAGDSAMKWFKEVGPHRFRVDSTEYEWMDGIYYKKVNVTAHGNSFGSDALLHKTVRNATIKTMDEPVHFATLSLANY